MKRFKIINTINDINSTNILRIPMRHLLVHKDEDLNLFGLYEKYESLINEYKKNFIPLMVKGIIEGSIVINSLSKNKEILNNLNSYTRDEIIRDFEICASELFNFAASSTANYRHVKSVFDKEIESLSTKRDISNRFRFYFGDVLLFSGFSNEASLFMDKFFVFSFKENRRDFFCYLDDFIGQLK